MHSGDFSDSRSPAPLGRKKVERPRELKWHQAGAMLYGDWGTSKAYVLGIAFAVAGHASWLFLGLMSLLTLLVGFCYTIICRVYPDGGGVYSALRGRSKSLAFFGALLLVADYVVTASLSALSAFHHFNLPHPEIWAIAIILLLGIINWVGPSKVSHIAIVIGIMASCTAFFLFAATIPHLGDVELTFPAGGLPENWAIFASIVLALSGVEAIANMTGIMVQPVEKTARKAILPVMLEVAVLTFLLGIAMNAVPNLGNHMEDMLRALGAYYVGPWYGEVIAFVFGLLLLSAVNTAINSFVGIQFSMAKDREIPALFTRLNNFGMPWMALLAATVVPILLLLVFHDLVTLAALYAIGVVGAITLNLGACALNRSLDIKPWERALLGMASIILCFIEITIAIQKTSALLFALCIVGTGFLLRYINKKIAVAPEEVKHAEVQEVLSLAEAEALGELYHSDFLLSLKNPNSKLVRETASWLATLGQKTVYVAVVEEAPPSRDLLEEAEISPKTLELFRQASQEMEKQGITAIPVWQLGSNPGRLVAYIAEKLRIQTVIIGVTSRARLTQLFKEAFLGQLERHLPKDCHLLVIR